MNKANVSGPFPDPPHPDFDVHGRPVPPWIKYPNLRRGSMGWRMGGGEWYLLEVFRPWWKQQPEKERERYRTTYPPPEEWKGYLDSAVPDFDSSGRMVPPWVKFRKLPRDSGRWRIAHYRKFIDQFKAWWAMASVGDRETFMAHYPEPVEWQHFLDSLNAPTEPGSST